MNARIWSNLQIRSKTKKAASAPTEYRARPLNADDIERMSSDELRWHDLNNKSALDAALKSETARSPQQREDARVTGLTSGASKEAGERRGWDATKVLTYADIQKMNADESLWQSRFNRSWKAAFDEEERSRASKRHVAETRVRLQWQGHATDEEIKKTYETGAEFSSKFPQFLETSANMYAMLHWMKDNDLPATELSSYVSAFRALSQDGKLEMRKEQSASDFYREHKELHPNIVPPLIQAREAKKQSTDKLNEETVKATAASGSTKFTDYPHEVRGPLYGNVDKQSFRALLRNLSAEDYQARLNSDPSFREAVDRIQNEK